MEEAERKIQGTLDELKLKHEEDISKFEEDNKKELKRQSEIAQKLEDQIKQMEKENKDIRDEKETQYWEEIEQIREKNKEELYKITKAGMDAKAELTLITEKYSAAKAEKDGFEQQINEKTEELKAETKKQATLRSEIEGQK
jgi:chromosome segregation ATPase